MPWATIKGDIVGWRGKVIAISAAALDESFSGGPLIKDGQVIGIMTEFFDDFGSVTPINILRYTLDGWEIKFEQASHILKEVSKPHIPISIDEAKKGIVKIMATTFEERRKVGAGFIVRIEHGAVYILTAAHVVEGGQDIEVEFFTQRNRPIPAKIIRLEGGDPQGIAALLVDENLPSGILSLKLSNSSSIKAGDEVTTIGLSRVSGVSWAVIRGDIVGRRGKLITISAALDEGFSGGPIIKDGRVIGIITGISDEISYVIPTGIVQYILVGWGIESSKE